MSDEAARAAFAQLRRTGATPAEVAGAILAAGFDVGGVLLALTRQASPALVHIWNGGTEGEGDPGAPRVTWRPALCGKGSARRYSERGATQTERPQEATCMDCLRVAAWRPMRIAAPRAPRPCRRFVDAGGWCRRDAGHDGPCDT